MIKAFLPDGKYNHENDKSVYIDVVQSVEYEDHYQLMVIWKNKVDGSLVADTVHNICVLKYSMREWSLWQK